MTLTFNNVEYGANYWKSFVRVGHTVTTHVDQTLWPSTLNGTIDGTSDTVTFSGGPSESGVMRTTSLDDGDRIVFELLDGDGIPTGIFLIYSNTPFPMSGSEVIVFPSDGLGQYNVPCFVTGTRILTRRGEVAVEDLMVGDEAVTVIGDKLSRIVWIGRSDVSCASLARPAELWPVRVMAGAFGPGQPHADLLLSPDHAVLVDGVLIPARYLENGTSIARVHRDSVTYFHIELERHDAVLAEGLATESYLDTGNRADFATPRRVTLQCEDDDSAARAVWAREACAPLHISGPAVSAVRSRLAARAMELGLTDAEDFGLRLRINGVDHAPERKGEAWVFSLEEAVTGAQLVSDVMVPATTFRDDVDWRCLGVPVVSLAIDGVEMRLDDARLHRKGWHRDEPGLRWTAGAAQLPPLRSLSVVLVQIPRRETATIA